MRRGEGFHEAPPQSDEFGETVRFADKEHAVRLRAMLFQFVNRTNKLVLGEYYDRNKTEE